MLGEETRVRWCLFEMGSMKEMMCIHSLNSFYFLCKNSLFELQKGFYNGHMKILGFWGVLCYLKHQNMGCKCNF